MAELWAGDVPLIGCRPGSAVLTVGGRHARGLVAETGLSFAARRLAAMSRTDRLDQEWVIRASLATRHPAPGHPTSPNAPASAPGAEPAPAAPDAGTAADRTPGAAVANGPAAPGGSPAEAESEAARGAAAQDRTPTALVANGSSRAADESASADSATAEDHTPTALVANAAAASASSQGAGTDSAEARDRTPAALVANAAAAPAGSQGASAGRGGAGAWPPFPQGGAAGALAFGAPSAVGAAVVADPERLLSAACGIADRILASAQDNGRRVNWLGLEPLDDRVWAVMPQGAGLPHGYCGTALFLAQIADLAGIDRYAEVARRALAPVPGLLAALGEDPADVTTVGAGLAGLGGIAYALGRLAVLLDDRRIAAWADTAVELASVAAEFGKEPGVLEGDAGCLAAMTAIRAATGSTRAAATAQLCADRLAALESWTLPYGGFDRGAAGIGWALLRFADDGGTAWHAAGRVRGAAHGGRPVRRGPAGTGVVRRPVRHGAGRRRQPGRGRTAGHRRTIGAGGLGGNRGRGPQPVPW